MSEKKNISSVLRSLSKDAYVMGFPLSLIFTYEIFHIKCYAILEAFNLLVYFAFVLAQGLVFWGAGYLADKYPRHKLMWAIVPVIFLEAYLIYYQYYALALLLSPFFCSTSVAKADIIYEHGHRSVKNLMCCAFVATFLPWAFFEQLASGGAEVIAPYAIASVVVTGIVRQICSPQEHIPKNQKSIKSTRPSTKKTETPIPKGRLRYLIFLFLSVGLVSAQANFFSIAEVLESFGVSLNATALTTKSFTIMGRLCLTATILSWLHNGNHKDLIYSSYSFLFLLSLGTYFVGKYWGVEAWRTGSLLTSGLGGFYLPIITEQFALFMGKGHYGNSVGITELLMAVGSILAGIILVFAFSVNISAGYLIISGLTALVSFKVFTYFYKKLIEKQRK